MKRFFLATVSALAAAAVTSAAYAADMAGKAPVYKAPAVKPLYDWSGFYLGGHLGYIWGRTHVDEAGVETEHNAATDGVISGVLAGYNWQRGPLVLGVDGDLGWTNAHGTGSSPTVIVTHEPNQYDLNWTTRWRGRLGFAADGWLFYVAGGPALADLSFTEGATTTTTSGGKYWGWSIGGGVEHAFTRHLVGRVEYLYDDFGHKDYTGASGDPYRVSLTSQTVRGALAWKFN